MGAQLCVPRGPPLSILDRGMDDVSTGDCPSPRRPHAGMVWNLTSQRCTSLRSRVVSRLTRCGSNSSWGDPAPVALSRGWRISLSPREPLVDGFASPLFRVGFGSDGFATLLHAVESVRINLYIKTLIFRDTHASLQQCHRLDIQCVTPSFEFLNLMNSAHIYEQSYTHCEFVISYMYICRSKQTT